MTRRFLPGCLVWGLLTIWSLVRYPIPGINEPHYLSKSRHFWDPGWCAGDFFLDSSNPHWAFYATFGLLASLFTPETAALLGRILGFALVAVGWNRLAEALTGSRWAGLVALSPLLFLQACGSWSGEWIARGIESKVPAYGCLFWGIACWLERRWRSAAVLFGLAVSFHPVVGVWGVLCSVGADLVTRLWNRSDTSEPPALTLNVQTIAVAGGLFLLASLPGLLPALFALKASSPEVAAAATQLLVANRLKHHLDPMMFPLRSWVGFGVEIVGWGVLQWLVWRSLRPVSAAPSAEGSHSYRQCWWTLFVVMSLLVALVGIGLGWGPRPMSQMPGYGWRCSLLKFYPFRLADLIVPVACSLAAANLLVHSRWDGARSFTAILWTSLFAASLWIPGADQNPSQLTPAQKQAWREACQWLKEHSEPTDLVYATGRNFGVKWSADRPEYVNYKDLPQDADSIIEWNRRLWTIYRWMDAAGQDGKITPDELATLRAETGIRYLLSGTALLYEGDVAYDGEFRIIELPAPREGEANGVRHGICAPGGL